MKNLFLPFFLFLLPSCMLIEKGVKVQNDEYKGTKAVTMLRIYFTEIEKDCSICRNGQYPVQAKYRQDVAPSGIGNVTIYFTIDDSDETVEDLSNEAYLKVDDQVTELVPSMIKSEIVKEKETDDDDGSISVKRNKYQYCKIEIPKAAEANILEADHISFRFYTGAEPYTIVLSKKEGKKLKEFLKVGKAQYSRQR